ncbi:MAG: hypothetical protein JXB17_00865 [Bacteroidales bacterium]|nr:hypothetical protein [Bacteroidales bacterium]
MSKNSHLEFEKLESAKKYMLEERWAEAANAFLPFIKRNDCLYYHEYLTCVINALETDDDESVHKIEDQIRELVDVRLHGDGFYEMLIDKVEKIKKQKIIFSANKTIIDNLINEERYIDVINLFLIYVNEGMPVSFFKEKLEYCLSSILFENDLIKTKKLMSILGHKTDNWKKLDIENYYNFFI